MRLTLKNKLILSFFLLVLLPMLALGSYSYIMSEGALQSAIEDQIRDSASDAAENIDRTIKNVNSLLEVASYNEELYKAAQHSQDASANEAFNYIKSVQKDNSDIIQQIVIVDSSGKAVMANSAKDINVDLSSADYAKQALAGKETVSEVLQDKNSGEPVVIVAYPLKNDTDKVVGALIGTIKFQSISEYASGIKIGNNGYAFMLDSNGLFVYHPQKDLVLKSNISDTTDEKLKSYFQEAKSGTIVEGFYDNNGVSKFARFQTAGNWTIAVTAEHDEYMAPARKILNNTIVTIIIALIAAMAAAYYISTKNIVKPIQKLKELMLRAGDGDLTVTISINSKDEIKDLIRMW